MFQSNETTKKENHGSSNSNDRDTLVTIFFMFLWQEVAAVFDACADPSSSAQPSHPVECNMAINIFVVQLALASCQSLSMSYGHGVRPRYYVDGFHVSLAVTPMIVEALHKAGVLLLHRPRWKWQLGREVFPNMIPTWNMKPQC